MGYPPKQSADDDLFLANHVESFPVLSRDSYGRHLRDRRGLGSNENSHRRAAPGGSWACSAR